MLRGAVVEVADVEIHSMVPGRVNMLSPFGATPAFFAAS
jgi:hypothetical protein